MRVNQNQDISLVSVMSLKCILEEYQDVNVALLPGGGEDRDPMGEEIIATFC